MRYDNIGRLLPKINNDKCIDCGLCKKVCPSLDEKSIQLPTKGDPFVGEVKGVFIGKSNDERIFINAQSGGLVTATLKFLLEKGEIDGAIVCCAGYGNEYYPKAIVITKIDDLYKSQKSTYVPVDIVSALKEVDNLNSLAIVGTGCHIQGVYALRNIMDKYQDKIKFSLGLICDRTLCKTIADVIGKDIFPNKEKVIIWRDKIKGYKDACLVIRAADGETKELPGKNRLVLKEAFTNPRCRICFDKLNVHSDLVFGDPWGMNNVDWKRGMSVVLSRTDLGSRLLSELLSSGEVSLTAAPLADVLQGQHIGQKRKDVSSSLLYYNRCGYLTPCYSENLISTPEDRSFTSAIDCFINDSTLTKDQLVKKYSLFLKHYWRKAKVRSFLNIPRRLINIFLKRKTSF